MLFCFRTDTLCCKLVQLVDLDVAQIKEKTGLLAGIVKNSAQEIHCTFGPRKRTAKSLVMSLAQEI